MGCLYCSFLQCAVAFVRVLPLFANRTAVWPPVSEPVVARRRFYLRWRTKATVGEALTGLSITLSRVIDLRGAAEQNIHTAETDTQSEKYGLLRVFIFFNLAV